MVWEETKEALESTKETYQVEFPMVLEDKSGEMEIGTSDTLPMEQYLAMENITRCQSIDLSKGCGLKASWLNRFILMK